MGRKKHFGTTAPEVKPFCYFCDRKFEDESVLLQHQRGKHFRCQQCDHAHVAGKCETVQGLIVHTLKIHGTSLAKVPNALPGRDGPEMNVYGMEGVPEELLKERGYQLPPRSSDGKTQVAVALDTVAPPVEYKPAYPGAPPPPGMPQAGAPSLPGLQGLSPLPFAGLPGVPPIPGAPFPPLPGVAPPLPGGPPLPGAPLPPLPGPASSGGAATGAPNMLGLPGLPAPGVPGVPRPNALPPPFAGLPCMTPSPFEALQAPPPAAPPAPPASFVATDAANGKRSFALMSAEDDESVEERRARLHRYRLHPTA